MVLEYVHTYQIPYFQLPFYVHKCLLAYSVQKEEMKNEPSVEKHSQPLHYFSFSQFEIIFKDVKQS